MNRLLVLVLLAALAAPGRADESENAPTAVARKVIPSVVKLFGKGGFSRFSGDGSAVVVDPSGIAITIKSVMFTGEFRAVLADGTVCPARVIATDEALSMVAIKIDAPVPLVPLKPIEPGSARVGQWVMSVGNAFGVALGEEKVSVNLGLLAAKTRLDLRMGRTDFPFKGRIYLTDANVNPGSYGGALVDLDGRLVGVLGRLVESRDTNTIVNFAVPIEDLKPLIEKARLGGGDVEREVTAKVPGRHGIRLARFALRGSPPAYVASVSRGSPAWKAGIRRDDLIIRVGGHKTEDIKAFRRAMKDFGAGETVEFAVKRGEEVLKMRVTLEKAEDDE